MIQIYKNSFSVIVSIGLFAQAASSQVANDNPTGVAGQFNGNITTGCSYDPYTGNATRSITDLVVAGGVGAYPLAFTRTMNSRYTVGPVGVLTPFGKAGNWNHSYGWSIDDAYVPSGKPDEYLVNYPDGRRISFKLRSGDSKFRGPMGVRDRFRQLNTSNPNDCNLLLPDGGKVHFSATVVNSGGRHYVFSLVEIIDPYGQSTQVQDLGDGAITVTEPAHRWIKIYKRTITNQLEGAPNDVVVDHISASDSRSVKYNYAAYVTPNGTRYTTLFRVDYFNDPFWTATYTYQRDNVDINGRPLIASCIDPMYDGPMWRIAYDFASAPNADGTAIASGQLLREKHFDGTPVTTLSITGPGARKETRGDNPTGTGNPWRTFTYGGSTGNLLVTTTDFKQAAGYQEFDGSPRNYLKSVTDRRGVKTEYTCDSLSGNTKHVKFPETPGDTLPDTPAMFVDYVYGNAGTDDQNNDDPDVPYYLFSVENGRHFFNKYYRDANKQIIRINYPNDTTEQFTYNGFGQKLTHKLRNNVTNSSVENWQYNNITGQLTDYWDAQHPLSGNPTTRYQYDSFGRVWKTTEGRGMSNGDPRYTTTHEYNLRGQLTKLTHPDGTYIENHYYANGTLQWTADELGHRTDYVYDDYKRVRTVTSPLRSPGDMLPRTTTTYYDDTLQCTGGGQCVDKYSRTDAKPTMVISPGNKTVATVYDGNLRPISVTAQGDQYVPAGTTTYSYDENGNRLTVRDPNGNVVTTWYDKQNRVKFIDDPMVNDADAPHQNEDGHTISYIYNESGNKVREKRVDNKLCRYQYNEMGRMNNKTDFDGGITHYAFDQLGNVRLMIDPNLNEYSWIYDNLSRKVSATYPVDANGHVGTESWFYDVANHLTSYTNPASQTQTLQYDSRGRLTNTSWNQGGHAVTTAYDAASRPLSIVTSEGSVVSYHYDDANNKLWEEQSFGGQPVAQPVQPIGAVSRKVHRSSPNDDHPFTGDINLPLTGNPGVECRVGPDHQIVITFANSVTFTSASLTAGTGNVSSTSGNGTNEVTVNVTGVTNGKTITVALWNATDNTTASTGNVYVQMAVLLGDVTGNTSVNSTDVSQVQFDSGSAVTGSNFRSDVTLNKSINSSDVSTVQYQSGTAVPAIEGPVHRVQTVPDADGNRANLVVTTGATTNYSLTYQYTRRNGVREISDGTRTFTYHYLDNNANVTQRVDPFGDSTTLDHDPLNRVFRATYAGSESETMNYEYDVRGNLRDFYRSSDAMGDLYEYDDLNQLSKAQYSGVGVAGPKPDPQKLESIVTYDCGSVERNGMKIYDGNGTLIQNIVYDPSRINQYKTITINGSQQPLQYDDNFDLISYDGWSYTYDAQKRLTRAVLSGLINHDVRFTYDGTGRCVKRMIDGATSVFTYDGWRPIAEWNGSDLVATNVYGIGIDEIVYRWSSANGSVFYKSDPLGNVRSLANVFGTLVEKYAYDAFGTATVTDADGGNRRSQSNFGNPFMFKGREYLSVLGVYDFRRRVYHPGLGHFLQVDPKGFEGSDPHNLFRFCLHNPVTGIDPMGEQEAPPPGPVNSGYSDPTLDAASILNVFLNNGALAAPPADTKDILDPPGDTAGTVSGSAATQGGNVSAEQGNMPNMAGNGRQDGTNSAAAEASTASPDNRQSRNSASANPEKVTDSDLSDALNDRFDQLQKANVPNMTWKEYREFMWSSSSDSEYYGPNEYLYEGVVSYNGVQLRGVVSGYEINYIDVGEGAAARGWSKVEMNAWFSIWNMQYPFERTSMLYNKLLWAGFGYDYYLDKANGGRW